MLFTMALEFAREEQFLWLTLANPPPQLVRFSHVFRPQIGMQDIPDLTPNTVSGGGPTEPQPLLNRQANLTCHWVEE